ncbi:DUF4830 domain-containing protein [Candidatus Omnitrophota bacterium]
MKMNKNKNLLLWIVFVAFIFISPSLSLANEKENILNIALNETEKYNLKLESNPIIKDLTLPDDLNSPQWGPITASCQETGYDLFSYAGQTLTVITYQISEVYMKEPLSVSILVKNNACVGAYIHVRENSLMAPGIFRVNKFLADKKDT